MYPHTAHRTHTSADRLMSNLMPKPACSHTVRSSPARTPDYKWQTKGNTHRERLKPPRMCFEMAQGGHNKPPRIRLSENCRYIQNVEIVQVEVNSLGNVREECKIKHNLKQRPARKKGPKKVPTEEPFDECRKPTLEEVTWLDSQLWRGNCPTAKAWSKGWECRRSSAPECNTDYSECHTNSKHTACIVSLWLKYMYTGHTTHATRTRAHG